MEIPVSLFLAMVDVGACPVCLSDLPRDGGHCPKCKLDVEAAVDAIYDRELAEEDSQGG